MQAETLRRDPPPRNPHHTSPPLSPPQPPPHPPTHKTTQDAESKELALEAKRAAKLAEADDMAERLSDLAAQLDDKRAEGEGAAARRAAVVGELEVLLAEHDTYKEGLTKIFYRWGVGVGVGRVCACVCVGGGICVIRWGLGESRKMCGVGCGEVVTDMLLLLCGLQAPHRNSLG